MDYKTRLSVTMTTGLLMLSSFFPGAALADTNVSITGNGPASNNTVNVTNNKTVNIVQKNYAEVETLILSGAGTGNNTANFNTGGNTAINTGNATSNISVKVTGGNNTANVIDCDCTNITDNVTIRGNGIGSKNSVNVTNKKSKKVRQDNFTGALSGVASFAKTGKNKANGNTNSSSNITTGNATSNVSVNVTSGSNTLNDTP